MLTCRCKNTGQNYNTVSASKSLEYVAKLRCLGMTIESQNCIQEEIESRLISEILPLFTSESFVCHSTIERRNY
jgi:hypothetical protein